MHSDQATDADNCVRDAHGTFPAAALTSPVRSRMQCSSSNNFGRRVRNIPGSGYVFRTATRSAHRCPWRASCACARLRTVKLRRYARCPYPDSILSGLTNPADRLRQSLVTVVCPGVKLTHRPLRPFSGGCAGDCIHLSHDHCAGGPRRPLE